MTTNTIETGTLVHVAPASLLLARNIREAQPDADLIRSVKAVGVRVPITAVLTEDGGLLVRTGHRRTLAAIEAGIETVPVYVEGTDSVEDAAEIDRVIAQRDENTHRAGLTAAEEIGVVETLTGLGLSAAQVAKRARMARGDVDNALTVSQSALARKAADKWADLTIEQSAALAEFDNDPEAVKTLVVAAQRGTFEHTAQRLRDDRDRAAAKAAATEEAEKAGLRVITPPSYDDRKTEALSKLRDAEGKPLDADAHRTCPGHVVWIQTKARDRETGTIDALVTVGCEGWRKNGHTDPHANTKPAAAMTEQEREEAKAARRLVSENNKAWEAAETVRREFVATFAKSKTAPKGTGRFLAEALNRDAGSLSSHGVTGLAADWLGVKRGPYGSADLSPAKSASDDRCTVVALVQVLAGYETALSKASWRQDGTSSAAGRYLRFLSERCGYTLSEVEQYAVSAETV